jgi:outer membrane protein OmpA-like peptidoglycan-associated protein
MNQPVKTAVLSAIMLLHGTAVAYELPEELLASAHLNPKSEQSLEAKLSHERIRLASGGFLLGALGGPLGAFVGTVLGDQWAQDQEQASSLQQQLTFWKEEAKQQKLELARLEQEIKARSLTRVNLPDSFSKQKSHLALLAWGLNSSIHFTTSSAKIEKHYISKLNRLVYLLNNYQDIAIQLSGYSDIRGLEKNNTRLSQERAESVKNYLLNAGIKENRIKIKAYGEQNPLYSHSIDAMNQLHHDQMAFDRRVDISFFQTGKSI